MVFKFHMAFALGLIALVAGTYLIAKVHSMEMCCKGFAKFVGWFVVVAAFLSLICSSYYSVLYFKAGHYCPHKMRRGMPMMMHHGKGMGMMKDCPHMKEAMEKCPQMKQMMEQGEPEEND